MSKDKPIPADLEFLSPAQISRIMGLNISTVRRYVRDGVIPASRVGRNAHNDKMLIPRSWVQALLTQADNSTK